MKKLAILRFRLMYSRHGEYVPMIVLREIISEDPEYIHYRKTTGYESQIAKYNIDNVNWYDKETFYYYTIVDEHISRNELVEQAKEAVKQFIEKEADYLLSSLKQYK